MGYEADPHAYWLNNPPEWDSDAPRCDNCENWLECPETHKWGWCPRLDGFTEYNDEPCSYYEKA